MTVPEFHRHSRLTTHHSPPLGLPSLADVQRARARLAASVHVTPVITSARVDRDIGSRIYFKCENFQKTGSFKSRGALNAVMNLSDEQCARGVVTVSAGNHAQSLAWAAATRNVSSVVVMPSTASRSKVDASEGYGAKVVFESGSLAAFERASAISRDDGRVMVHPFDDEFIIAGAGTAGVEFVEQVSDLDAVIIPIGGGGLISGMAVALKALAPRIKIFGVEPTGAASMRESIDAGKPVRLAQPPKTIADGLAAPMSGELTYEATRRFVDDVVLVEDDAIADAMKYIITRTKMLVEPAGAAAFAALRDGKLQTLSGKRVGIVISGGNVDLTRLC